jgi:hypothetical protein
MTTLTSRAISTLIATYYPDHFFGYGRLSNLTDALIESGSRFAADCGANPAVEFKKIAASYQAIIADPEYPALRDALDYEKSDHQKFSGCRPVLNTRYEMTNLCHSEIQEIARAEGWHAQTAMQFAFLQTALLLCAALEPGREASTLEGVCNSLKKEADLSGGSWTLSASLDTDAAPAKLMVPPMIATSHVFSANFEKAANQNFTDLGSAQDGDLTGMLMQHSLFNDGFFEPRSTLLASVVRADGQLTLHRQFPRSDIRLQAMAGIVALEVPTIRVVEYYESVAENGSIFSLHFNDFGMLLLENYIWDMIEDDAPGEMAPAVLLGDHGSKMTSARMNEIRAASQLFQQHPDLSWMQNLECKPFGSI